MITYSEDAIKETLNCAKIQSDMLKERISELEEALIWCSGSDDFSSNGKARIGWLKICEPLLDGLLDDLETTESDETDVFGAQTKIFSDLIKKGWIIANCSCSCGGNYAWMKPRKSGAYEMVGCICHQTPISETK